MCFPFSIQEMGQAGLEPELPVNLWRVRAVLCFFFCFCEDDEFAQSPVAVTAGFQTQAHPDRGPLHCRDPKRGPSIWQK